MLQSFERLEPLGNNLEIIVSDMYHFSTDTILLADFAQPKTSDKIAELGTGCGTIPLLWCRQGAKKEILAIDIQDTAINMLSRSIEHNQNKGINSVSCITPLCHDLKNLKGKVKFGHYDVVVCNPPYKLSGSGITNPDNELLLARHEQSATLCDICSVAAKLLQFSGRFCMCQRPERLTDVLSTLREFELEPKRLRFVQQRKDKEPKLFLVEARYKGKPGFMQVMPTLFIENEDGNFSDEMLKIYGIYKEGRI